MDDRPYLLYEPAVCDLERWRAEALKGAGLSLSSALRLLMWAEALRNRALASQDLHEKALKDLDASVDQLTELELRIEELQGRVDELEAQLAPLH